MPLERYIIGSLPDYPTGVSGYFESDMTLSKYHRPAPVPLIASLLTVLFVWLCYAPLHLDAATWQDDATQDGPVIIDSQRPAGQVDETPPEAAIVNEQASGLELVALRKQYDAALASWVEAFKNLRLATTMYFTLPRDEAAPWKERYEEAVAEGNAQRKNLELAATELFRRIPDPDDELQRLILRVARAMYDRGEYENSLELNKQLMPFMMEDDRIYMLRLSALAMLNRYDETIEFIAEHSDRIANDKLIESVHEDARENYYAIQYLHQGWIEEQEIREKEREADDLPRVQIKTSKGTITVELFENEAPLAVNNFVALCEKGFYDGLIFHRVINHFMAQTGGFDQEQQHRQLAYTIQDEYSLPESRHHFRGSLAMARTTAENSASSEFYITFCPKPGLDGSPLPERQGMGYTVFGRVIAGWEVLDSLTRTFEVLKGEEDERKEVPILDAVPDYIISTKVIRKRDREYEPTPFAGRVQIPVDHGHDH